ncbi:MAG: histidinol-phosphate aminotransferase family protein [bacterium]|nr:histidinol-phosphate aminotransferase family protein [bacterium]
MTRFLRRSLLEQAERLGNYAHRPAAACDLSLISGPCVWAEEIAAALSAAGTGRLRDYPLPAQDPELVGLLAAHEQIDPAGIWLTPGADVAIEAVLGTTLEAGDRLGILVPNFPRFDTVAATIAGLQVEEFTNLSALPSGLDAVAVCTPNNPSTEEIPEAVLRNVLANNPETLFVVDGVFDWLASYDLSALCRDHDNVVVLKSFSKIGLAGLRLGYLVAAPDLCADLQTGLSPFSVPGLVQDIGREVARRFDRIDEFRAQIDASFAPVAAALGNRVVRSSPVPFYLLETVIDSTRAADLLFAEGISVVDGAHFRGLPANRLRVAIGDRVTNARLLDALDSLGIA